MWALYIILNKKLLLLQYYYEKHKEESYLNYYGAGSYVMDCLFLFSKNMTYHREDHITIMLQVFNLPQWEHWGPFSKPSP